MTAVSLMPPAPASVPALAPTGACPNSDPGFDRILTRLAGDASPATRRRVFYGVCIWARLLLVALVYAARGAAVTPYLVGAGAALAATQLATSGALAPGGGRQWWSKRFHLVLALLLLAACAGRVLAPDRVPPAAPAALLAASLAGGIALSATVTFC